MIVYIAGPITGIPNYRSKFAAAETLLKSMGYIVLSPAWLPDGLDYEAYMRIDKGMIREADALCLLPGWLNSPGTIREVNAFADLGKQEIMILSKNGSLKTIQQFARSQNEH